MSKVKKSQNLIKFIKAMKAYARAGHFSQEGLIAIFPHIDSDGKLDIVEVCCKYVEIRHVDVEQMDDYGSCKVIAELDDSTVFVQ